MAKSLAHTKWQCKYYIVFTPRYRRKIIYNKLRADIQKIGVVLTSVDESWKPCVKIL